MILYFSSDDTIATISMAPGIGVIGIVKLSGKEDTVITNARHLEAIKKVQPELMTS